MRRAQVRPSAAEMELLDLLWTHGPSTIAEVHERLGKAAYTTVQTRLNRLVDKKLAERSADRPARYAAAVRREDASAGHLGLLVERLCGGRIVPLVAQRSPVRPSRLAKSIDIGARVQNLRWSQPSAGGASGIGCEKSMTTSSGPPSGTSTERRCRSPSS